MKKVIVATLLFLMPGTSFAQAINFDGLNFPCISYNIARAQANGQPTILTRTTVAGTINANRAAACNPAALTVTALNTAAGPGTPSSCDEYPFASSNQGGVAPAAGVIGGSMIVPAFENNAQGGAVGGLYNNTPIANGGAFTVTTSNVPAVVYNGPAAGAPNPPTAGGISILNHGNGIYQCYY